MRWVLVIFVSCAGCGSAPPPADEPVTVAVDAGSAQPVEEDDAPEPEPTPKKRSGPPTAEEIAAARETFRRGLVAYEEGDYAAARKAFEQALELSDRPILLFNIVRAATREGDSEAACHYYRTLEKRAHESEQLKRALDRLKDPCTN